MIQSFKQLDVWATAMDLAMTVYHRTKEFPVEEKFSLTDQVRRSSRSVAANISEAWRKRRYPAAFVSKLNDAESEAAETQTWAEVARRCGYLADSEAREWDDCCEKLQAQLVNMISRPEQWCAALAGRSPQ